MEFSSRAYWRWLFLLIAISGLTHWHWLLLPGIFTANDFWYLPNQVFLESLTIPTILDTTNALAAGITTPTFNTLNILGGILVHLHFGFSLWERIVFLWPIALLSPIPIYLFLIRIFKYPPVAFVGSIIYAFNTYILARETMHLHIVIVYFLAPALFIAFEQLLKKQSKQSIVTFIAIAGVCSIFEIRILYICTLLLIAYGIYLLAIKSVQLSWKLARTLIFAILPLTMFQSYWLLPFIFANSSLGYVNITSRGLFESFDKVSTASTLSDPFWTGATLTDFIPQHIPWWAYSIPFVALLWIFFKKDGRKKPLFWFWGAAAVIGIFLVKESNNPFPDFYGWLFTHIPGFRLFRDASKFNVITALSYAVLAAGSIAMIRKKSFEMASLLIVLISGILLTNTLPFITGSIASMTISRTIPPQFLAVQRMLEQDTSFGRSLWVPADERFVFESQTHPRLSLANLTAPDWYPDWLPYIQNTAEPLSLASQPIFKALLDMAAIRYIGEPFDYSDSIYKWYSISKSDFSSIFNATPGLQRIENTTDDMPIWKNPDAKPLLYIADNVVAVHGPLQHFSGIDPSIATAFVFQPDVSQDIFHEVLDHIATNNEFIPFLSDHISIRNGSITSTETLPESESLQTIVRSNSEASTPYRTADTVITAPGIDGQNLLQVPILSRDPILTVGDCNNQDKTPLTQNGIKVSLIDIGNNAQAFSIEAHNHIACVTLPISSFDSKYNYLLSVTYKTIRGTPPRITLYPNNQPTSATVSLPDTHKTWSTYTTTISGNDIDSNAGLIIYLPTDTGAAQSLFTSISLIRIPILPATFIETKNSSLQPIISKTQTIQPTLHTMQIADLGTTPRLLVLSDRFDSGWKLFVKPQGFPPPSFLQRVFGKESGIQIADEMHIKANGFANGWIIDPRGIQSTFGSTKNIELVIRYQPQRFMDIGTLISITTLIIYLIIATSSVLKPGVPQVKNKN